MVDVEKLSKNLKPTLFYTALFFCLIAFNLMSDNYDYDLFARLIVGKYVIQTGHVLKHDFLSYTPTHLWYDHEWGSSVIFYLVQHFFSHIGLLFLQVFIVFFIFFIITKIVKLRGVKTTHPYNFAFYFFASSAFMQIYYQPVRCHIFSFLFFTLFLYILELSRKGENRPLFAIPVIMLIWNNIHGGCVSGLGLIVIYIIGELINKKPIKKYILTFLATLLVLPINPWGTDYIVFLLKANTMARPSILEWQGLFFPLYKNLYLEFKFFASVILFFQLGYIIKSVKSKSFKFDATKYLIVVITLFLAIEHIKLIPLSVITISAFFYDDFYSFFNSITRNVFNRIALYKDILVYTVAFTLIFINLKQASIKPFLDFNKFPISAIEFIRLNNLKGNLLINFEHGSYASYKLYPNVKIYMDGRYEEVYDDAIKQMLDSFTFGDDSTKQELLKIFPTDFLLLYRGFKVYPLLLKNPNWTQIFSDNNYALFIKTTEAKKKYKMPSQDIEYYKRTLFDTNIDFKKNKG